MSRIVSVIKRMVAAAWRFVFKPAARYPADPRAVFILALSVFSGLLSLIVEAAPPTLEALLPRWGVVAWSIGLALGSALTLGGMAVQSLNGILAEQIGSVFVGVTTVFYSVLVIFILHGSAMQTVGIILAWGLSCFIRWAQLQALINASAHQAQRNQIRRIVQRAIDEERDQ